MIRGDKSRFQQVLLSVIQNAAHEARLGAVIKVDIWEKPLSDIDIGHGPMVASNINILDYNVLLFCSVSFEHNDIQKSKLNELNLE